MYPGHIGTDPEPGIRITNQRPYLKEPKHDQVEGEFFYIKQTRMVR